MTKARIAGAAVALALAGACMTTIPVEDREDAGREWTRYADLSIGERAIFDGGALDLTLTGVGADEVTLIVEHHGIRRQERLRTGIGGIQDYPPYEIRLVSTSVANTATIEVSKR